MNYIPRMKSLFEGAYKYTLEDVFNHPEKYKGTEVSCIHCGRTGVTLRKLPDGNYICNECYNKEKGNE